MNSRNGKTLCYIPGWVLAFLVFFAFPLCVSAGDVTVPQEQWEKVLQKIEELSQQNKKLNERIRSLESGGAKPAQEDESARMQELNARIKALEESKEQLIAEDVSYLKEDVEELSEIMMDVERRTLVDKVQIGAELRTRVNWFDFREKLPVRRGLLNRRKYYRHHEEEVHALINNRFRLNLSAKIRDNLKFTGRLTMFKNWNDDDYDPPGQSAASREPTDSRLLVERAYVDYFFNLNENLPLALTFGRLPMADGLPTNLRDDTPRKSTFPSLAYDVVADGAALSLQLDKLTGLKNSAFRLIYLRTNEDNDDFLYRNYEYNIEENNTYIAQFETMLPGKYLQDILSIITFSYVPDQPTINLTESGPFRAVSLPNSIGSYYVLTLFLQAERFLGSNFDWFLGIGYNSIDPSDRPARYRIGPIPVNVGLAPDAGNERETQAHAIHVGFRYNAPISILNNPKIGVEYNYGSKYWYSGTRASEDPLNKLQLNGHCWDFYYIQPITKNFMIRAGYTWLRRDYPLLTQRLRIDRSRFEETVTNAYFLLDARF